MLTPGGSMGMANTGGAMVAPQMAASPPIPPVMPPAPPVMASPTPEVPPLGASLEPQIPMPTPNPLRQADIAQDAAQDTSDAAAVPQAPGAVPGSALLKTLQGVQMPAPPLAQKVSTPHLPPLKPIQGGGLMELMAQLGIGPQQAMPGLKLPSTLGQSLGGR